MPHTSCLVSQGVVAAWSAVPFALVLLVVQLVDVSACTLLLHLLYNLIFAMYAGIAYLHCVCWDSMSSFPNP